MKKKVVFYLVMLTILLILVFFGVGQKIFQDRKDIKVNGGAENGGLTYKADGTVEIGKGFVGHGFYRMDGTLTKDFELYVPIDGVIRGKINLQQNREEIHYMVIALVDFQQVAFTADGRDYWNYPFTLSGDTEIEINVEVDLKGKDGKEAIFMIVEEPDFLDLTYNNAPASVHFNAVRIRLTEESTDVNYDDTYQEMDFLSDYMFQLTESHEDVRMLLECKGGEDVELTLGSKDGEDMNYAIIAFAGWKQCPLWDGEMVQYVKVPKGKNIYYDVPIPKVPEDTPYQIFGFVNPYAQKDSGCGETATLRTVVKCVEGETTNEKNE